MIWVAWRTQRLQLLVALIAVIGCSVWLFVVGSHEQDQWALFSQQGCYPPGHPTGSCVNAYGYRRWQVPSLVLLYLTPGVLGVVIGAPVVARELELGTTRLAWTQGVSRTRWLIAKLLVPALVIMVLAGVLVAVGNWWIGVTHAGNTISPPNFDVTGVVMLGYVVLAFSIGTSLGALLRRPAWAIVVGLPLFALVRMVVRAQLRAHLATTHSIVLRAAGTGPLLRSIGNGWILHMGLVPLGRVSPAPGQTWATGNVIVARCTVGAKNAFLRQQQCVIQHHLHQVVQFQPSDHFWPLQLGELAIFLGLAAALLLGTVFIVRHAQC